jgi:hypothetical protein
MTRININTMKNIKIANEIKNNRTEWRPNVIPINVNGLNSLINRKIF